MPAPSFKSKQLRITFTLTGNNATFAGSNNNVLQLTGLRATFSMQAAGAIMATQATLRVYGMAQADMNALSVVSILNGTPGFLNNTVLVEADSGNGFSAVFAGAIVQAGADYSGMPDVCLEVHAQTGFYEAIAAALPTSFPGSTSVADKVSVVAAKMGVPFQNDGVDLVSSGASYYSGSLLNQVQAICEEAHIAYVQDGPQSAITITPWGSPRSVVKPVLTPQSGLVGYPKVRGDGFVEVRSLYDPAFALQGPITIQGSQVVVGSNVPTTYNSQANGDWIIGVLSHYLEANKPGGAWFSDMVLYPVNAPAPAAA